MEERQRGQCEEGEGEGWEGLKSSSSLSPELVPLATSPFLR